MSSSDAEVRLQIPIPRSPAGDDGSSPFVSDRLLPRRRISLFAVILLLGIFAVAVLIGVYFIFSIVRPKYGSNGPLQCTVVAVADLDSFSRNVESNIWESAMLVGKLRRERDQNPEGESEFKYSFESEMVIPFEGRLVEASGGTMGKKASIRGMELSALKLFRGKLYSCCDRTGIVYELMVDLEKQDVVPLARFIFPFGDGVSTPKGMKCEWLSSVGNTLYVGSTGKEWTTPDGVFLNDQPMWVKKISPNEFEPVAVSWEKAFMNIRAAFGPRVVDPGYIVHEAVEYNPALDMWFFMPRYVSEDRYDDEHESEHGSNVIVTIPGSDPGTGKPTIIPVNSDSPPNRGFSDMKFVPGRPTEIVALKTAEEFGNGVTKSYLTVVDVKGKVLLEETFLVNNKFEGLELIDCE